MDAKDSKKDERRELKELDRREKRQNFRFTNMHVHIVILYINT